MPATLPCAAVSYSTCHVSASAQEHSGFRSPGRQLRQASAHAASAGKHRGFGFIEFEGKEDAGDAIDNMNNAELYGRTLRVNYAQPMKIKGGEKGFSHQAVWADSDNWWVHQQSIDWKDLCSIVASSARHWVVPAMPPACWAGAVPASGFSCT